MALIVVIQNISNLAPTSDYTYEVLVGDGTERGSHRITGGRVNGHVRADGWIPLVQKVLDVEQKFQTREPGK